jgi:hypothetical protein
VKFVNAKELSPEQLKLLNGIGVITKEKHVEVPVINAGYLKPGQVVDEIEKHLKSQPIWRDLKATSRKFSQDTHRRCFRYFDVRPSKGSTNPAMTKKEFCCYDSAHRDYLYTEKWVEHLKRRLIDLSFWEELYPNKYPTSSPPKP